MTIVLTRGPIASGALACSLGRSELDSAPSWFSLSKTASWASQPPPSLHHRAFDDSNCGDSGAVRSVWRKRNLVGSGMWLRGSAGARRRVRKIEDRRACGVRGWKAATRRFQNRRKILICTCVSQSVVNMKTPAAEDDSWELRSNT
jgi:hypothetical protein